MQKQHSRQTTQQKPKLKSTLWVTLLAALLILAILAGTWWYLFASPQAQQNTTTHTTNNQTGQTNNVDQPKTPDQDIDKVKQETFKIPELGIQFVLPEGLEGLEYEINEISYIDKEGKAMLSKVAYFTTKALREADEQCTSSNGPIGAISSVPESYDFNASGRGRPPEKNMKHINTKFFIINGAQSLCSDKEGIDELQFSRGYDLLLEAFQSLEVIRQ